MLPSTRLFRDTGPVLAIAAGAALALAGCTMTGGETGGLAPALTAAMDRPGASLDRGQAIALVNSYRTVTGAPPLTEDPALDAAADAAASQYAATDRAPPKPAEASIMRVSGGYSDFAETFSGWRNSPPDAAALADPGMRRAGIAQVYNAGSSYGTHWILLLAP